MRLPAVLDQLVLVGDLPMTAAVFISPVGWAERRVELLDDPFVDLLADAVIPELLAWLGDRWRAERATAVGASLGAVAALRAALRRSDRFDAAIALSGPLTEHRLRGPLSGSAGRFFLSASREEERIVLDDGLSLLDATAHTAAELEQEGHTVRFERGEGGHTYAAWEAMLPTALSWIVDAPVVGIAMEEEPAGHV
jgi:enterochelin esterase-like enzyme